MERKAVSGIMLTLLLISMLTLAFNIQPISVEASLGTVVAVNGSKTPSTDGALVTRNPDDPDPPYDKFLIYINIMNVEDLYAFGVRLSWSPGVLLEAKSVKNGGFLPDDEFVFDVGSDYVAASNSLKGDVTGESGDGNLVRIIFEVMQTGNTSLSLTHISLINSKLESIPYESPVNGTFYTTWPVATFTYSPHPGEYYGRPIVDEPVTFNASASYDPDDLYDETPGGIVKYEWDFGDGMKATETEPITDYPYEEAGNYYVTLKVTDDDDETYSYEYYAPIVVQYHDIEILNVVVNSTDALPGNPILINVTVLNNGSVTEYLNVSAYYDNTLIETKFFEYLIWDGYKWMPKFALLPGQNETTTIIWNTTGVTPGVTYTIFINISIVNPSTLEYIPDIEPDLLDNAGTYGEVAIGSHDIAIINVTCSSTTVSIGQVVDIEVTVTNEGDFTQTFDVTTYYGDFGIETQIDINLDAGANTTLTFQWNTTYVAAGTYTITAEASQVPNEINTTNNVFIGGDVTVEVPPDYPVANFTYYPENPLVGESVTFNSTSYDDDGYIDSWKWDFNGDGVIDVTTENATWTYTEPGEYTVRLIVTDNDGLASGMKELITVYAPPTANFTYSPEKPLINQKVAFNASLSTPNGGIIVSYEWDFGDGTTVIYVEGINLTTTTTHQFITSGTYTVVLTVTDSEQRDSENLTDSISKPIKVLAPPVAKFTFSPPYTMRTELITFNASASHDDEIIVSYEWDFGDGTTEIYVGDNLTAIITHTYTELLPGGVPFYVTLNVTDNDGLFSTFRLEVYVLPIHDIAVSGVVLSSNTAVIGDTLSIDVTVKNEGDKQLTDATLPLNVTIYFDETKIETLNVTEKLAPDDSYTLSFTWDTTKMNPGAYTIKAIVETKKRDLNTANDELIGGAVTLKVRSTLTVSVHPENITLGETITINGTINPTPSGVDVTIYYRLSGETAWTTLTTVKTEATGKYQHDWTPQAQGTYQVKASWAGDETSTEAESSIVTVVVKEKPAVPLGFNLYIVIGGAIAIAGSIMALYFFKVKKKA